MKLKLTFALAIAAIMAISTFGQVGITKKTVNYTRKKPIVDYKKTFTINYPKIKAATPALSRKIEAILSYEKVFDFKLADELGEIQWLEEAEYDVSYNANKLLSVSLTIIGSGAYPSTATKYLVVNTTTGTQLTPGSAFVKTPELLARIVKMKDQEVINAIRAIKNDPETKDDDVSVLFADAEEYHKVTLDEMEVKKDGVMFHYDYGFPHVAQGIQPSGEFFLTWAELKPYIKAGGPFTVMAR